MKILKFEIYLEPPLSPLGNWHSNLLIFLFNKRIYRKNWVNSHPNINKFYDNN